jgi:hypothetical protein
MAKGGRGVKVDMTERGFELVVFFDHNGIECSLQQSSMTDLNHDAGATAIWLGCDKNAVPHMGHDMSPRMHLDRQSVVELAAHLQAWLETGSFRTS